MSPASCIAASAASRRPRAERWLPRLLRLHARSGRKGVGLALREAPIDVDGLLRRGQRLLAAAEVGKAEAKLAQFGRPVGSLCTMLGLRSPLQHGEEITPALRLGFRQFGSYPALAAFDQIGVRNGGD